MILDFLKEHLHPSSPFTILLVMSVGVACLFPAVIAVAPPVSAGVLVGYWFIATHTGASLLVAGLGHGFSALHSREEARGAEAVVVLGGGAATYSGGGQVVGVLTTPSILRALEGAARREV